MSRTLLAFTSALLLAAAGCAEEEAARSPGSPDAGGTKPGTAGEPDGEESDDDGDGGSTGRRKTDASTDGGPLRDAGIMATGMDGGPRASAPTPSASPTTGVGAPSAPAAGGATVADTSRADVGAQPAGPRGPTSERLPTPDANGNAGAQNPPDVQNPLGGQNPAVTPNPVSTPNPASTPRPATAPVVEERPAAPPAPQVPQAPEVTRAPVAPVVGGGVRTERVITAGEPIFFDLENGSRSVDFRALPGWDLTLFGTNIMLNPGAAAAVLSEVGFDSVSAAPASGFRNDPGGADPAAANFVLSAGDSAWFSYDSAADVYTPRRRVYVVRTGDGSYFKLAVLSYYDAYQNPGYLTLQWAAVRAP